MSSTRRVAQLSLLAACLINPISLAEQEIPLPNYQTADGKVDIALQRHYEFLAQEGNAHVFSARILQQKLIAPANGKISDSTQAAPFGLVEMEIEVVRNYKGKYEKGHRFTVQNYCTIQEEGPTMGEENRICCYMANPKEEIIMCLGDKFEGDVLRHEEPWATLQSSQLNSHGGSRKAAIQQLRTPW